jgi:putative peptidoglycan lipid II flippase
MATKIALLGYGIGLPALILIKILAPGFYARQDIKTPVRISLLAIVITQAFSLSWVFIFSKPFPEIAHGGLTLAISLGACCNAGLLFLQLRKKNIFHAQAGWLKFILKILVALVVFGVVLWLMAGNDEFWLHAKLVEKIIRLGIIVCVGIAVYFGVLFALGVRVRDFIKRV